jgi:predicted O-linked N-acetylglucosamine transferase (SPINDLY family)
MVPKSRLLMKADGLDDPGVAHRIAQSIMQVGISADRLDFRGRERTYAGHLAAYGQCDLCLDTLPYAGTTTTCEALWMGVPVMTTVGQTHPSRVGASLLAALGLSEEFCVDLSPDSVQYIANVARDVDRLAEIRRGLRERFANSPLADARSLTLEIERAYAKMWDSIR